MSKRTPVSLTYSPCNLLWARCEAETHSLSLGSREGEGSGLTGERWGTVCGRGLRLEVCVWRGVTFVGFLSTTGAQT